MHRSPLLRAIGPVSVALIVLTGTMRGDSPAPLAPLQFLLGEWEGIGDQAGATGGFTFAPGVQDRVIVRTNYSNTPPHGGTPASRHDDLMVIYVDAGVVKADYFDNEGHVIYYSVVLSEDKRTITLLSEPVATAPRFRFIYNLLKDNSLSMEFDIAPPGKPDSFSKYVEGKARRQ